MDKRETGVQFKEPSKYAKEDADFGEPLLADEDFDLLSGVEAPKPKNVRFSVTLPEAVNDDIAFIEALYTEFVGRGLMAKEEFSQSKVLLMGAKLLISNIAKAMESAGGFPRTAEERQAAVKNAEKVFAAIKASRPSKKTK